MTSITAHPNCKNALLISSGALAAWIAVLIASPNPRDFTVFYAAGQLVVTHPHWLYSLREQRALMGDLMPWAHVAPEALLFAPLTLMKFHYAAAVWDALSIGTFIFSGWLLRDEILRLPAGSRVALLVFSYFPISDGLRVGQDHGFFLLLWVLAYRNWKAGDEFSSGLWIGVSLIRYQFAVPMLFFFVVLRAWKLLQGVAMAGLVLLAASFLIVGRHLFASYWAVLRCQALISDAGALRSLPSLRGFAALVVRSHPVIAAAVGGGGLLAWALVRVPRMNRTHAFCFAMTVSLLCDPHAYLYEMTVLVVPYAVFLWKRPAAAMLAFCLCALTLAFAITRTDLFSVLVPVLLGWTIWTALVYNKLYFERPDRVAAGGSAAQRKQRSGDALETSR